MITYQTNKSEKKSGPQVELNFNEIFTGVQTEKAVQVKYNGSELWLARSMIKDIGKGKILVPAWMLNQAKGDSAKKPNSSEPDTSKNVPSEVESKLDILIEKIQDLTGGLNSFENCFNSRMGEIYHTIQNVGSSIVIEGLVEIVKAIKGKNEELPPEDAAVSAKIIEDLQAAMDGKPKKK